MEVRHEADEYEARLADVVNVVSDTIRRRWLVLLAVTVGVFLLGVVLISLMTPHYSATAKVRLDPNRNPLASSNGQQARAELSDEAIETEVKAAGSLDVARAIVKSQRLMDDPEFTKVLAATTNTPLHTTEARETVVANELLQHVTIAREQTTYVLGVTVESIDPIKAANLANAFASAYIETRTKNRADTAREQNAWYQQQLANLNRDATEAEGRAAQFRAHAGILESSAEGGGGGTIVDQQVAPLSGSLAQALSDAASAKASLSAAEAQIARGRLDAVTEVLGSPLIQELSTQRAAILSSEQEIEAHYGPRHPESIKVQQQLAAIDAQLNRESNRIIASLRANVNATQERVDSLRQSLSHLEAQRERSVVASSAADGLAREAEAKRALYDKMSAMSLDSMQTATADIALAVIVNKADVPAKPSFPNKPLLYALTLMIALMAGTATVAGQEMLSGGFRSIEDLEAQLGIPVLAVVPKVTKGQAPAELMLERPTSMFAEAFRIARTAVLGARDEANMKVIAVTSSLPAEGKTTSAVAFARTLAIANARVLLLECDVRRAAVRGIIRGGVAKAGLVELLHGEISLDEAIQPGDVPNLDQILVTAPYFSAENLFGEGRIEQLLGALRARYDYIVLDLPPLMGLADGRFLAAYADVTMLIVKWKSTPVSAVTAALGWLRKDGSNPVGVIYTQIDPSAHSVGSLYYYSKQYSDYYQAA
ncbi:capsular exopolysaccharide family [Novosphingobium sp. CF614]|uniref:GumC family protein n=1 Tax=Novosphingobium sp. CF614 TaxID=1884364 RepID=UPI0008DEACBD|nr:AAA family ATPase [Novosphingobium sp. CF614]SFG20323.1 capsular exopolysaccharide family [Novosphingobium sp. CF614]